MTISSSPSGAPGDVTLDSYDAAAHVYLEQSARPGPAVMAYLDAVAGLVGNGTVLELGSGPGWDADYLESRGARVLRTDGAPAFVQMLKTTGHHARLLDVRMDDFGGPYDAVLARRSAAARDQRAIRRRPAAGSTGPCQRGRPSHDAQGGRR